MFLTSYYADRRLGERDKMVDLLMEDPHHSFSLKTHITQSAIKPGKNSPPYHHPVSEILQQMSFTSWNEDFPDLPVVTSVEQIVLLQCEGLQVE